VDKSSNTSRYFIGVLAPELISQEIIEFQKHFDGKYKSKGALRSPPHLTLISPFLLPKGKEQSLISFLNNFSTVRTPFEISIDGFGSFGVGVIYAAIEKSTELKNIEKDLADVLRKRFNLKKSDGSSFAFSPHVTLAFKDLTPPMFQLAWAEYAEKLYRRKWQVTGISLFQYSFDGWKVLITSQFNSQQGELKLDF